MVPMEAAEKDAVEELKRRTLPVVTPEMLEDELLFYRFCKARDFNVSQAESMLRKHLAWRKEFQIDTILDQYKPPEVLAKYAPSSFLCLTKDGCNVRYVDCGGADLKGLLRSTTKIEFMKFFMYYVEEDKERVIAHRSKPGSPLMMYVAIFDFQDFTYANATSVKGIQWLLFVTKSYMDNYPEKLKCAMFINAPSYCAWMYALLKQVLPSTVKQKIRLYDSDGWREDLLELVDADHLPAFLGGTKTDPDGNPLCKTFIKRGEPIPERYYTRKERGRLAAATDSEKLTVLPFSRAEVRFEVKEAPSLIDWEFELKAGDIDYSMHFRDGTPEERQQVELVPKHRTDACNESEKGVLKCEKAGTYTIMFDNSYSWVHSKQVYYRARIRSPGDVEKCDAHEADVIIA